MIKLPMPPTVNHVFRARTMAQKGANIPPWVWQKLMTVLYRSSEAKEWTFDAQQLYAGLKARMIPKGTSIAVLVGLVMSRRGTDIENRLKVLLDAFNELAWEDDSQIDQLQVFRLGYDTKAPRVELSWRVITEEEVATAYANTLQFNQQFGGSDGE